MLFCVVLSFNALAKTYTIERSKNLPMHKEEIKNLIFDYTNYGDSGKPYKLTGVKEIKIIGDVNQNEFFICNHFVNSVVEYQFFNKVTVSENSNGVLTIITSTPSDDEIATLEKNTGIKNSAPFDNTQTVWTIEENYKEGVFVDTSIKYSGKFEKNSGFGSLLYSTISFMAPGLVEGSIESTANDLFATLEGKRNTAL